MKNWNEIENLKKVAKNDNPNSESDFLFFKKWEGRNGEKRIYINDYRRRTIGYLTETGELELIDRQGNYQEEIDTAIKNFEA